MIGNVGDSRAIMGSKDENDMWKAIQLTVDLKPNLPRKYLHNLRLTFFLNHPICEDNIYYENLEVSPLQQNHIFQLGEILMSEVSIEREQRKQSV